MLQESGMESLCLGHGPTYALVCTGGLHTMTDCALFTFSSQLGTCARALDQA
jgi:hypothetical protein